MEIEFFESWDAAMEAENEAREAADARVSEEQMRYRSGDIVVSDSGCGFPIFHELLDNEKIVRERLFEYGESYETEGIYILDLYNEPHMKYYRFANNYSVACPEGELGDFHISSGLYTIPRDVFEELKKIGFRRG